MGNIFNLDNPFFTALGKMVDIIFISIIWLICCIPVVTIIPATSALYYTVVKVIRRDRGYLTKEFFHAFKMNFKTGLFANLIIVAVAVLLLLDRRFVRIMEGNLATILFSVFNGMIILLFFGTLYISPVLSRFSTGVKNLFKTSFLMAFRHFPTTILVAVITLVFAFLVYLLPIILVLAPALCCLLSSFLLERVLKKYMPEKSEEAESNGVDEWYLE